MPLPCPPPLPTRPALLYLDDRALPCDAAEVVVEHAQADNVQTQRQELGLHVHNRGALQGTGRFTGDNCSVTD